MRIKSVLPPYNVVVGINSYELIIRHSTFIASVKGDADEEQALSFIKEIRKKHSAATHNCYAFIADEQGALTRFSDDGEPGGTAGQPILEVLKKRNLKMTVAVVTRYFGGIKLGAGGLVSAYSKVVGLALDNAIIREKRQAQIIAIETDFASFSKLEKHISPTSVKVIDTVYSENVNVKVAVDIEQVEEFVKIINNITNGKSIITIVGEKYHLF